MLPGAALKHEPLRRLVLTNEPMKMTAARAAVADGRKAVGDAPGIDAVVLQREWLVSDAPEALEGLRKTLYLCEVKIAAMVGAPQFAGSARPNPICSARGRAQMGAREPRPGGADRRAPAAEHRGAARRGPASSPSSPATLRLLPARRCARYKRPLRLRRFLESSSDERVQAALHAWYAQDKYPDGDGGRTASAMDDLRKIIRHHARLHAVATAQIASGSRAPRSCRRRFWRAEAHCAAQDWGSLRVEAQARGACLSAWPRGALR